MITMQDSNDMSGLYEAKVLALAEQDHVSEFGAAALGAYLFEQPCCARSIAQMIKDDIRSALDLGDKAIT